MTFRGVAAIAFVASLFHLSWVRADVVCSAHVEQLTEHGDTHHPATADASSHAVPPSAPEDESCDTPSQPECCQALATCSALLGVFDRSCAEQCEVPQGGVIATLWDAPLSRVATPDPPPPKL